MPRYLRYLVATAVLASCSLRGQISRRQASTQGPDAPVTSVTGESWLGHLHKSFDETSMGKTDQLGPRAPEPGEDASDWALRLSIDSTTRDVTLRGSDLYRLNCQACHRDSGQGAPPEINSIIDPVRATSTTLVRERMKSGGMSMSRAAVAELAKQSEHALLQRLHSGGQDMPAFPHLSTAETNSLVTYMKELAGVPGVDGSQRIIRTSPIRIGELIVKSTCHICHGAAGPNPNPAQLEDGAIPPLATLTARTNLAGFIRKVTVGAPVVMGNPPMIRRGRMPVFDYLSQDEAADVYLYLTLYPPSETGIGNIGHAPLQATQAPAAALLSSSNADGALALQNTAGGFDRNLT